MFYERVAGAKTRGTRRLRSGRSMKGGSARRRKSVEPLDWRGQRLKTLLTHVELANYCVYELINWKVDKEIYNKYVLSPIIDSETDSEMNWRRPLWEFFYPRIRKENSSSEAAEIVVRNLRERMTIVSADKMSAAHWPSGVETIWRNQITDEKGFERIYVATLRSVGIGARSNSEGKAEFWTGSEWKAAPPPLITSCNNARMKLISPK